MAAAATAGLLCSLSVSSAGPTPNSSSIRYYSEVKGYVNAVPGPYHLKRVTHRGEYFEVVTEPLNLSYAQVHYRMCPTVQLPAEIVSRFANRTMAITGFENQVSRIDEHGVEHAVPCSDLYNHHWNLFIMSSKTGGMSEAEVEELHHRHLSPHEVGTCWQQQGLNYMQPGKDLRTLRNVSSASACCAACSAHAWPSQACAFWTFQYATRTCWLKATDAGREQLAGVVSGGTGSRPSYPPFAARIPIQQVFSEGNGNEHRGSFHGTPRGYAQLIDSPATAHLNHMSINTRSPAGFDGNVQHAPQPKASSSPLPGAKKDGWSGILECPCTDRVERNISGHVLFLQSSGATKCHSPVATAAECWGAAADLGVAPVAARRTVNDTATPAGCYVARSASGLYDVVFNADARSAAECKAEPGGARGGSAVGGSTVALVNVSVRLDAAAGEATLTLSGPAGAWFGVGFNATQMRDLPYAIVVDGDGAVSEHKLANHEPGAVLARSVKVQSSGAAGGVRTVRLTRPLAAKSPDHFGFAAAEQSLPLIVAVGGTVAFQGPHKGRAAANVVLVPAATPACVCKGGPGSIAGRPFSSGCIPGGVLERENNGICSAAGYLGGMKCCSDGVILLDKDQVDDPRLQKVDSYYHKLRIYFEEYDPATIKNAFRLYWQTEEWNGEYAIPQCAAATRRDHPERCVHTIDSNFTARDLLGGLTSPLSPTRLQCDLYQDSWCGNVQDVESDHNRLGKGKYKLLYMAFHQHSPAVISGELWNADTGELICRNEPLFGATPGQYFDEAGYAYGIPPCVWGSAAEGLPEPPVLDLSTNLRAVARYNNTLPHYGVMAMWQGRGGI